MPPRLLGAILGVGFILALLVRRVLVQTVVLSVPETRQARRQFYLDFLLCVGVGVLSMIFNAAVSDFPIVRSGFKLVLGCTIAGFFVAIDMALDRERSVIIDALSNHRNVSPPQRLYPMTRKFSLIAIVTTFFVASLIALVISADIGWLAKVEQSGLSLAEAKRSVGIEIFFVMGVLLVWVVNLIFSYSKNLKLLFHNETGVLEKVTHGDLSKLVPVVTNDEFGVIAGHTNKMIEGLRHRMELITALRLAQEVQESLLPRKPPRHPRLDVAGTCVFCDETGGDYYDYIQLPTGRLGIVVGDVSGHGIPSALLMATVRAFIRQRTSMAGGLAEIVADVNRQFVLDVEESGNFMTMFYAEIDPDNDMIHWVRAGHDPAMIYDPARNDFSELSGRGLPLGVVEDTIFEERQRKLRKNQLILIGTDGIWETRNAEDEMFGKERFREVIRRCADEPAEEIVRQVLKELNRFRGFARQLDDVTLVIVKVTGG